MIMQRRSFIAGLAALVAAPVVVKASGLMKVAPTEIIRSPNYLTLQGITRTSIQMWRDSNRFLIEVGDQYHEQFAADGAKIGSQIRIRLPSDFVVVDAQRHSADIAFYNGPNWTSGELDAMKRRQRAINAEREIVQAATPLALAAAAAAIAPTVLAKPVTRRFWAG